MEDAEKDSHPLVAYPNMDAEDFGLIDNGEIEFGDLGIFSDDASEPMSPSKMSPSSSKKKKKGGFRKAPQAPRRFKSPYILFSISKMAEYKNSLKKNNLQVTSVSSHIAKEWKALPPEERKKWDQVALQDKLRYNAEKRLYTGPWQVPTKRSRKDPSAPKRPPSAFLFYCQTERPKLKRENPDLKNTEISKLLGQQWKNAPIKDRKPHIEREQQERESYKSRISEWRRHRQNEEDLYRKHRQAVAEQYARTGGCPPPPLPPMYPNVSTCGGSAAAWESPVPYAPTAPGSTTPPRQPSIILSTMDNSNLPLDIPVDMPPSLSETKESTSMMTNDSLSLSQDKDYQVPSTRAMSFCAAQSEQVKKAPPIALMSATTDQEAAIAPYALPRQTSTINKEDLDAESQDFFPHLTFAYSDRDFLEAAASSAANAHNQETHTSFPSFFHGGETNNFFEPSFPKLDSRPVVEGSIE